MLAGLMGFMLMMAGPQIPILWSLEKRGSMTAAVPYRFREEVRHLAPLGISILLALRALVVFAVGLGGFFW